ncbi:30S ribosome-binding factor [Buchnera aphidicola (Anoecia corni)]|uniref:Ribosome-binding factor A n=1 Tax=Buchnera aphidicola (Anoecia corni) TaxID=2994477 RepID=A0AAT9IGS1_9GAMM
MNGKHYRSIRISEILKKEISYIFLKKINDPRIINSMLTILDITLSKDLFNANVYIGFITENNKNICNKTIKIIQNCSGYVRLLLSKKIQLRIIPILNFKHDTSFSTGNYISNIINQIKKK